MYRSFKRLVEVPSENLPPAVQKGAPSYPCWICVDEYGRTLIVDTTAVPARFWDPQKKAWRSRGPTKTYWLLQAVIEKWHPSDRVQFSYLWNCAARHCAARHGVPFVPGSSRFIDDDMHDAILRRMRYLYPSVEPQVKELQKALEERAILPQEVVQEH